MVRSFVLSFLVVGYLGYAADASLELINLSKNAMDQIAADFDRAAPEMNPLGLWHCEVFAGSRGLKASSRLYHFVRVNGILQNNGALAHMLNRAPYKIVDGNLQSSSRSTDLTDIVRRKDKDTLVTRLSQRGNPDPISYAVCHQKPL